MGMPINISYNSASPGFATGPQVPVNVDWTAVPFNVRCGVFVPNGSTASYSIEYCMDDVNAGATPRWFTDATLNQWQTASGVTSFATPIQFVRLNLNALRGTVELKIVQGLTP
jgi:hypothetical protein